LCALLVLVGEERREREEVGRGWTYPNSSFNFEGENGASE